jgi:carbon-monoxide dehydrogenase large subunit
MNDWATAKFGIGQPVRRTEDPVLLQGRGRYTDDVNLAGQAYGVVLRSRYAHGIVRKLDASAAKAMPGVLGIFLGAEIKAAGYGGIKCIAQFPNRDGTPFKPPFWFPIAVDRVRHVGEPLGLVVAESADAARDAAEAIEVEIDDLPAVTRASAAAKPGAPLIHEDTKGNVALDYHYGDTAKVDAAFAAAAHVVTLSPRNTRVAVAAMEPRAAIAAYDAAAGKFTLHVGCQGAFGLRGGLAEIMRVPTDKLRILSGNVGGSFGMKAAPYPEYVALLHAARALGRPVKWTADRSESFLSDTHGRDHEMTASLALDREGNFLALRVEGHSNMGAYVAAVAPIMSTLNAVKNVQSVYRTPLIEVSTRCTLTNTTPVSAYRGAGRPEGNYYMERLIETAAAKLGVDGIALRRKNMIRPEQIPYAAASGMTYDSGDFERLLDRALAAADWDGYAKRKAASEAKGLLRGRGLGCFLEVTAPPGAEMGGIRFEANGDVTIVTGTLDYGQGHAAAFAQVLSSRLGIPFERIRLLQGDSDQLIAGGGTGGSRSITASGMAIVEASDKVVEAGKAIAAHVLEASVADVEFARGRFVIAGTDRGIGLLDLAAKLRASLALPEGLPKTLDVSHATKPVPSTFPNGCHVAEVEIDPETGVLRIDRYVAMSDFGTVVNPLLVEGQVHGGIVQGAGQVMMENVVYDAQGQLLSGTFADYAMPRADDMPSFVSGTYEVPAKSNPLGTKGCGEAGSAGALPSLMNAVHDALGPLGVGHLDMPASPERIWQAIRAAKTQR